MKLHSHATAGEVFPSHFVGKACLPCPRRSLKDNETTMTKEFVYLDSIDLGKEVATKLSDEIVEILLGALEDLPTPFERVEIQESQEDRLAEFRIRWYYGVAVHLVPVPLKHLLEPLETVLNDLRGGNANSRGIWFRPGLDTFSSQTPAESSDATTVTGPGQDALIWG